MNADELKEEIAHQRALIKDYENHIRVLEEQQSAYGLNVPSNVPVLIKKYKRNIQECESKIVELNIPLIQPKKDELDAFRSMIQVLSNYHTTKWVFSKIAGIIGDVSDVNDHTMHILIRGVRDTCLRQIARLEKEISEIENL